MNVVRKNTHKFFYITEMGLILVGTHCHLNLVLLGENRATFLSLGRSDVKIIDKSRSESHGMVRSEC